jgi:uroporphyrinogen III methyltransferase/synthase
LTGLGRYDCLRRPSWEEWKELYLKVAGPTVIDPAQFDQSVCTSSTMTKGIVYLVGAGPGDPGLVTVRAKELLSSADVVVYDFLVHPNLLAWCRPECEKIHAGQHSNQPAMPPEEIETLLVNRARAGRRVVRLKCGDPFVFGRGGEEARRLAADHISFEVVPGVTAAVAAGACAGIPLAPSNEDSAVVFLTGAGDPKADPSAVDWRKYGALPNATLAIYSGMDHLRLILSELIAGGLQPDTPAAAVQWASLGRQRSVTGTAATLAGLVEAQKLGSPAVILVGEAVRGHEATDWFAQRPLFGRRIVTTRAREQSGDLHRKLEDLGADVLELALVEIKPFVDRDLTLEVFAEVGHYDWLVFTSANGVRHFFDLFLKGFRDLRALGVMRIACVGEATARAVRALHLEVEICPETASADALAEAMIATGSLDHGKVLIVTGNLNRDTLVNKLQDARAIVDRIQVYENRRTELAEDPAAGEFRRHGGDAILFSSASAVQSFVAQAAALQLASGAKRPLTGSIGPITTDAMRQAGIAVDFEAKEATLDGFVGALVGKLGVHG